MSFQEKIHCAPLRTTLSVAVLSDASIVRERFGDHSFSWQKSAEQMSGDGSSFLFSLEWDYPFELDFRPNWYQLKHVFSLTEKMEDMWIQFFMIEIDLTSDYRGIRMLFHGIIKSVGWSRQKKPLVAFSCLFFGGGSI